MQKSPLQYGKIIFQSKVIPLFLPSSIIWKCILYMGYTIPNMGNTVDFLPYMVETVGKKKKKRQNMATRGMAKWGGHQNSKNSNFRDSFLNIEKEFHHTVKDFFA